MRHRSASPGTQLALPAARAHGGLAGPPARNDAPPGEPVCCELVSTAPRVSTGLPRLDAMLGGGLLPGTLTVAYGATGVGKTHLGLTFAHQGREADGTPGLVVDMNARGDSQQHDEYAARLFDWPLTPWTHTVTPMTDP